MTERFDLVVIGGGPAGEKGAAQAAYFGKRVCVIEMGTEPGGAAVHTGTLPSKTLRETAIYLSGHRNREIYGVSVKLDDPHAAVPKLIARKDVIADVESMRIRNNLFRHQVDYLEGRATITGPHTVSVAMRDGTTRQVEGEFLLIATGSSPVNPTEVPIADPDVYDSDEILSIDALPDRLVVLGAGVIGCEYACMFAALGVKVTLVEARNSILPFLDHEMGARLLDGMRGLGIETRIGQKWTRVWREPGQPVNCQLADGSLLVCEKLLFAAGRVGNTKDLGLEVLGITPTSRGALEVDDKYRTKVPHVYAVGDVIGFPALASTSMEQARFAVCDAFGIRYRSDVLTLLPYGIYTIPEVSCVGESEQDLIKRGVKHVVGRAFHKENARGQIQGDDGTGLTKLIVHADTRRVIGVHVIGDRASELVHAGLLVMQLGGTVDVFIETCFNYPTLGETYKYAAYDALGQLAKLGKG